MLTKSKEPHLKCANIVLISNNWEVASETVEDRNDHVAVYIFIYSVLRKKRIGL